jgi:hypothetical protein
MPQVVTKGTSLSQEATVYKWKNGVGGSTIAKFSGTEALILAKKLELETLGWETETTEGPVWKLQATFATDLSGDNTGGGGTTTPQPEPAWELTPTTFEQSIYETGRPLVTGLPNIFKDMIEWKLKNPTSKDGGVPYVPYVFDATPYLALHDRIYCMRRLGIDGRQAYYWTLKRSVVIKRDYQDLDWTIVHVGKVLSTNKVKSLYNVPLSYAKMMPPSFVENEITSMAPDTSPLILPFYYGWLEGPPSFNHAGTGTVQVSQTWTYNKWSVTESAALPGLYDAEV